MHNAATSWLATMYAIEYAALFDVINPGLAAMGAPIALGGTSNHFRTEVLRRVGGWDAWNVAEDADLGIRLARSGVRVATFDPDTYEEAPARLSHWLGQRRRWQKGWLQTALVHSRNPTRLVRELGYLARAFSALGLIGGTILGCLFGPLFTALALWRAAFGDLLAPATPFRVFVSVMAVSMLLSGLIAILVPPILGLRRRGLGRLSWALALLPIYYCLISLATWLAVYDFVFWPFYWCKTQHGVGPAGPPSSTQSGRSARAGD